VEPAHSEYCGLIDEIIFVERGPQFARKVWRYGTNFGPGYIRCTALFCTDCGQVWARFIPCISPPPSWDVKFRLCPECGGGNLFSTDPDTVENQHLSDPAASLIYPKDLLQWEIPFHLRQLNLL
jgi:hypothetical protein